MRGLARRAALAALGAVLVTGALLVVAAQLVRERPLVEDITQPQAVSLVTVPRDEARPEPEPAREPEPPREPPRMEAPPAPMLSRPPGPQLAGPAVALDPSLFGHDAAPTGQLVFDAADLDQAPRGVSRSQPMYPYKARQRGIEGVVRVRFLVRRDGTVGDIVIVSADPPGVFEQAVRDAIATWRFEPGVLAGEPVPAWVDMPVSFDLGRRR